MSTEEVAIATVSPSVELNLVKETGTQKSNQHTDITLPPVGNEIIADLQKQAQKFLQNIGKVPVNSPAFESYLRRIENLGHDELSSIGGGSKRLIERNIATLGNNLGNANSQEMVGTALSKLDGLVKELAPTEKNISPRNLFGFKKRNPLNVYFDKYNEAQETINDVVKVLLEGKDLILRDNAMLEQEKQDLVVVLNTLQEYLALIDILEQEVANQIENDHATSTKSSEEITSYETEILFAIRQKKQDILSRMTVGSQAYLAMSLIRDNNKQLHKSIDNARATTITALRTAVLVAQSLSNQKNLLDNIETIVRDADVSVRRAAKDMNGETRNLTARNLDTDRAVAELTRVFDRVQTAIDTLTEVKEVSEHQMQETIGDLNKELENSVELIEETVENQQNDLEEEK